MISVVLPTGNQREGIAELSSKGGSAPLENALAAKPRPSPSGDDIGPASPRGLHLP